MRTFTFRIPEDLYKRAAHAAVDMNLSIGAYIVKCIQDEIDADAAMKRLAKTLEAKGCSHGMPKFKHVTTG